MKPKNNSAYKQTSEQLRIALAKLEQAEMYMFDEDLNAGFHIGNAIHQVKEALYYVKERANDTGKS